jgi:hypothetical protein
MNFKGLGWEDWINLAFVNMVMNEFLKRLGISRIAEQLLASHKSLCYMELLKVSHERSVEIPSILILLNAAIKLLEKMHGQKSPQTSSWRCYIIYKMLCVYSNYLLLFNHDIALCSHVNLPLRMFSIPVLTLLPPVNSFQLIQNDRCIFLG